MQRWLGASLSAGLLAVFAGLSAFNAPVRGADQSLPNNERRLLLRHNEESRRKRAEKLRLERAQRIARERQANSTYSSVRPTRHWVPFWYPIPSGPPPQPRSFYW